MVLTLILRCSHAALCNLLCRHYKKVLNWEDLSIKLKYSLEKEIFMENKNILLISYRILHSSQEGDFLNLTWLMIGMKILIRSLSGAVHIRVKVRRMNLETSGLVEWPWLQLICCAVCLPRGHNFRWWGEVRDGSECWMVCCRWTPEIEFNKRLSSSIIRLANYSVTTSLIYKLIV